MSYLKIKKTKLLISLIVLFLLFQIFKFIKSRITSINLPKGKIVFSANVDGDDEIYTMNINGSGLKQLTKNSPTETNTATDREASFSPDGKKIVFVSRRQEEENYQLIYNSEGKPIGEQFSGGTFDIYIMDLNGKNQIPLTYNTVSSKPFFSPDAKKVIFNTLLVGNHNQNLVKTIDMSIRKEKTLNFGGGQIDFLPDGKKIIDNFEHDISIAVFGENNRRKLTHLNDGRELKLGIDFTISPDAKKLIVITRENKKLNRLDDIDDFYDIFEFYTMNLDGFNLEKIYRIDGSAMPELLRSDEARRRSRLVTRIHERLPDGSVRTIVSRKSDLRGYGGTIWQVKFSLDSRYIIFNADFLPKMGIYQLNLENKNLTCLTSGKEKWNRILDFTFTPDGKKIVFVADIYPKNYFFHGVILHNIKSYTSYFLFRKQTPYYDNKYICVIDIDGKNYRRIAKLPIGTELGRDFIHWGD